MLATVHALCSILAREQMMGEKTSRPQQHPFKSHLSWCFFRVEEQQADLEFLLMGYQLCIHPCKIKDLAKLTLLEASVRGEQEEEAKGQTHDFLHSAQNFAQSSTNTSTYKSSSTKNSLLA